MEERGNQRPGIEVPVPPALPPDSGVTFRSADGTDGAVLMEVRPGPADLLEARWYLRWALVFVGFCVINLLAPWRGAQPLLPRVGDALCPMLLALVFVWALTRNRTTWLLGPGSIRPKGNRTLSGMLGVPERVMLVESPDVRGCWEVKASGSSEVRLFRSLSRDSALAVARYVRAITGLPFVDQLEAAARQAPAPPRSRVGLLLLLAAVEVVTLGLLLGKGSGGVLAAFPAMFALVWCLLLWAMDRTHPRLIAWCAPALLALDILLPVLGGLEYLWLQS